MKCCAKCFGDRGLSRSIIPHKSDELGKCSFCESEAVQLVSPRDLAEYFELLVSAYRADETGELLVKWFRRDWRLFAHPQMDDYRAKNLLSEILDDGEIVRARFSPSPGQQQSRLIQWEELRNELMYKNRFFPQVNIDHERLQYLLSSLTTDAEEVPTVWFRARIQHGEVAFNVEQMGAPPNRTASHGRANPAGIPYLYLASTQTTAVSEIRPHTGEVACVCEFGIPKTFKFVDLRDPRSMVSPFILVEADEILRLRGDLPFLERLGDELTRPVLPQAAAIDYTPSQYLCEFIKTCGYQGVIYRSSVGDGINLALFDPSLAEALNVKQYQVSRVSVDVREIIPVQSRREETALPAR